MSHPLSHFLWLLASVAFFCAAIVPSIWSEILRPRCISSLETSLRQARNDLAESANRNLEYRAKLGELADEKKNLESQSKSDLWRAHEIGRQYEEERKRAVERTQELEDLFAPLSPLRVEALTFRRRLQRFIDEIGSEPVCDSSRMDDPEKNTLAMAEWLQRVIPFRKLFRSTYQVQLHHDAVMLSYKFTRQGITDPAFGELLDNPDTIDKLKALEAQLWAKAGMLQNEKS